MITIYTESYVSAKHIALSLDSSAVSEDGYFNLLDNEISVVWGFSDISQLHNAITNHSQHFKTINKVFSESELLIKATGYNKIGSYIFFELCSPFSIPVMSLTNDSPDIEQLKSLIESQDNSIIPVKAQCKGNLYVLYFKPEVLYKLLALKIIVQKEMDIETYVPTSYWHTKAELYSPLDHDRAFYADLKFDNKESAKLVQDITFNKPAIITGLEATEEIKKPPPLHTTDSLIKAAASQYDFQAVKTTQILNVLYEKGLCSKPEAKQKLLPYSILYSVFKDVNQIVINERIKEMLSIDNAIDYFTSDLLETDNHAIIPYYSADVDNLSEEEKSIYFLLCDNLVGIFLPESILCRDKVETTIEGYKFYASGTFYKQYGWRCICRNGREDTLPALSEGMKVRNAYVTVYETVTKPPNRFNDATYTSALKSICNHSFPLGINAQMYQDADIRAKVMEELIEQGYIFRKGKTLYPTDKAFELIHNFDFRVFEDISAITQEMSEQELENFLTSFKYISCDSFSKFSEISVALSAAAGKCPICQSDVVLTPNGWICSGRKPNGCEFRIYKTICGKTLNQRIVKQLLNDEQVNLKGFISKNKKSFDAGIALVNGKIEFRFNDKDDKNEE